MKRKSIIIFLCIVMTISMSGCALKGESSKKQEETTTENVESQKPDIIHMRTICELGTLKSYYHNVAKTTKKAGTGLSHFMEKKRIMWIEYTGIVTYGVDLNNLKMVINDNEITITLPKAKVLNCEIESLNENDYKCSEDGINKNVIDAEEQSKAINTAQEKMLEKASTNTTMLNNAQERAKKLLENYINQCERLSKVNYDIIWEYDEDEEK